MQFLDFLYASIYGVIQGITEWLPISSTGHLILAEEFLKLPVSEQFWNMFLVVIQLGSILAVLVLYFQKLNPFSAKKSERKKKQTFQLWLKVLVGIIPAGVIGLLINDLVEDALSGPIVVAIALLVYGILFIVLEKNPREPKVKTLNQLSYRNALEIGAFQVLALIPGTSRSGSTILGGMICGTAREVSAEFSFFLAIPVMAGASLVRILKFLKLGVTISGAEIGILIVGTVVAFVVSLFAIKFLMGYIRKHDFKAFGYYRIVLGVIVIAYFLIKWFVL